MKTEGLAAGNQRHYNQDFSDNISYRKINGEMLEESLSKENSFSLFLIEKGNGTRITDGNTREVNDGELHFVFSGQQNSWNLDKEKRAEIETISISDEVFETFGNYLKYPFSHYIKVGGISLSEESFDRFKYEFSNMDNELNEGKDGLLSVESRLKVIMLMLSKEIYKMHYEKRMDSACLLSRFITLVFDHFREYRSVKFYADKLAVTTNYLNVLCAKHLGRTATGIINSELLTEVKQYLIVSNISIKELSILMNFSSINSFYAFFKKHTGMTPKEFQNKYKGINTAAIIPEDL
ncbi:helix-turn-helix transcriptional regulator [Chryseobacterium sp. NRRL B-14859]|uniref:helix-turn-helix domain-containing protein n=1 Tax=unclassified Chryseobacterium TaxID=2593645 RepID=UPI000F459CEB|nr:helix-turn-helix transcriptional regulator [Chryseobacterium sp. G0240]ROI06628.1 AraC family transcriptional regulator [Chryseobacterium sp. G0240]